MTAPGTGTTTFTIATTPELGAEVRRLVYDCPHGTTTLHLVGPAPEAHTLALVRPALARRVAEQGCQCTADLHRRCAARTT